jgi:hypothetical protein
MLTSPVMFSVDYKQIQALWVPWAQKCCLDESHIKKAIQAFLDFLVPPEMRELLGFSNASFARMQNGMNKQTEKDFQHASVLLEEVCTMTKDMPADRKEGTDTSPHLAEIRVCVDKVRGLREDMQMLQRGVDKTVHLVEGLVPHIEQTRELAVAIKVLLVHQNSDVTKKENLRDV